MMSGWDVRNDLPLVSVCVTTYNHGAFISQCLDSLLEQETSFPYEICVGEDESSDETRRICMEYAEKFPQKIRLFLRSRKDVIYMNGRPTGRFNFIETMRACRGRYLAICEGDDYWNDPQKLQLQVDALESNPGCALCFCNVQVEYQDETPDHPGYGGKGDCSGEGAVGMFVTPSEVSDITRLARGNYVHTPAVLFRNWMLSADLPDFMMSVGFGDWALHMYTARMGKLVYIDRVMAAYRVHSGGMWSSIGQTQRFASTIRAGCLMAASGAFVPDVADLLSAGVESQLRRLWRWYKSGQAEGLTVEWYRALFSDYPEIARSAASYARKLRFIVACQRVREHFARRSSF